MGKFYITTAIDYVNDKPHIGHALEKIQADVIARYHRLKGDDVFFLTGTDEHGQKIAHAAKLGGNTSQEFADAVSKKFKALKDSLNLSWDDFIRTTDDARHRPGAELMWKKLEEAGALYKKKYKGLYCVGHEAFITEKELVDGKCPDHGRAPEVVEEENYFFKLSEYGKKIKEAISSGEFEIVPEGRKNEILSLIEQGLEDISFSRSKKHLEWGIPIPGDPDQVMYVWCDALTNYLSAIGYGRGEDYKKWWPADVQVIGKDILRFHAAIWPAMLLAAGLPLPKALFVHGFITVDGKKMSKTVGNVVDPIELVKKYGTDAVRYYFLREIPSGEDGDFSEEKFKERYNGDLANGLGNFAARVLTLAEKQGGMKGDSRVSENVQVCIEKTKKNVAERLEVFKFHEASVDIRELISFGDQYVNQNKPWETNDSQVIFDLVVLLDNIAALLAPFLPETADKVTQNITWAENTLTAKKGEVLFPRI